MVFVQRFIQQVVPSWLVWTLDTCCPLCERHRALDLPDNLAVDRTNAYRCSRKLKTVSNAEQSQVRGVSPSRLQDMRGRRCGQDFAGTGARERTFAHPRCTRFGGVKARTWSVMAGLHGGWLLNNTLICNFTSRHTSKLQLQLFCTLSRSCSTA